MARRRRRRSSFIEDMIEIGSSGFYGAAFTCAFGIISPIILDWLLSKPNENPLIDAMATGFRQGALPYFYGGGLIVSGISVTAMIYFLVRDARSHRDNW